MPLPKLVDDGRKSSPWRRLKTDTAFAAPVTGPQHAEVLGSEGMLVLTGTTRLVLTRPGAGDEVFTFPEATDDVHEPSFMDQLRATATR